jgi:HEAT repeat protein
VANQDPEIERILASLRTDDPPVEHEVLQRVKTELRAKDPSRVSAALAASLGDADPEYRCTIASVFMDWNTVIAVGHVSALVHDAHADVRGFISQELGAYRRREAVPALVHVLTDDDDGTNRVWAAWGLGNIGDPAALPALRLAMQNDDGVDYEGRPVKEIAAEAIRRITQEKAVASVA